MLVSTAGVAKRLGSLLRTQGLQISHDIADLGLAQQADHRWHGGDHGAALGDIGD